MTPVKYIIGGSFMTQKFKPLYEVFPEIVSYLENAGYSSNTIGKYKTTFRNISYFMEHKENFIFDSETCQSYITWLLNGQEYKNVPRTVQNKIRCANAILEFQFTGNILFHSQLKKISLPNDPLFDVVAQYLDDKRKHGYKETTLYIHHTYLIKFCHYLIGQSKEFFDSMTREDIFGYLENLAFHKAGTISSALAPLKAFLHYLYVHEIYPVDLSYLVPRDPAPRQSKLPSHYSQEEIGQILSSIDQNNPKGRRNYAILMLIVKTGLRVSDVISLKFENICWEQNQIELIQYKTGNPLVLPLLPDVGNAIIRYLKNDRPVSELRNIFLSLIPPYHPMTTPQIRKIVSEYINKSGVNKEQKTRKHGPHALRHSLAGQMLEKNIPLPVISSVLGHTTSETTSVYLGIDIKSLRQCALEVPKICEEGGKKDA